MVCCGVIAPFGRSRQKRLLDDTEAGVLAQKPPATLECVPEEVLLDPNTQQQPPPMMMMMEEDAVDKSNKQDRLRLTDRWLRFLTWLRFGVH